MPTTFAAFDAHYNGSNWERTQKWPTKIACASMEEAIAAVGATVPRLAADDLPEGVVVVEYDDDRDEVAEEVIDLR